MFIKGHKTSSIVNDTLTDMVRREKENSLRKKLMDWKGIFVDSADLDGNSLKKAVN